MCKFMRWIFSIASCFIHVIRWTVIGHLKTMQWIAKSGTLENTAIVWNTHQQNHVKTIGQVQHRAARNKCLQWLLYQDTGMRSQYNPINTSTGSLSNSVENTTASSIHDKQDPHQPCRHQWRQVSSKRWYTYQMSPSYYPTLLHTTCTVVLNI